MLSRSLIIRLPVKAHCQQPFGGIKAPKYIKEIALVHVFTSHEGNFLIQAKA